jgi:NitT/TauT family transport system substrate-binding protein
MLKINFQKSYMPAKRCLMQSKKLTISVLLLVALVLTLSGCALGGTVGEDKNLKMGLIPVLDVLPFYIAQDKGYFEAEGLKVELAPVKSSQEQNALLQASEIDGTLTDLISTALLNRDAPQVKVVAKARKAYRDFPHFRILAAPGLTIDSPAEMAGVKVGISQNTVIQYLNDRLLTEWGVPADQITTEEVSAIPTRFELLMNNQLDAALLPDPLAQAAIAGGASLIVDDAEIPQYSQSVLVFNQDTLQTKSAAVRAFMRAWNKAVTDINQDPDAYRDVLIEKTRVPESIQGTYNMPPFPENEITTAAEWQDVVQWATAKGLLDKPVAYDQVIDKSFVE